MFSYRIVFDKRVSRKDLPAIPIKDRRRIIAAIDGLIIDPRPRLAKRLSAREEYRLRQGDYRILYTINDEIVTVIIVKVSHRKDVYK